MSPTYNNTLYFDLAPISIEEDYEAFPPSERWEPKTQTDVIQFNFSLDPGRIWLTISAKDAHNIIASMFKRSNRSHLPFCFKSRTNTNGQMTLDLSLLEEDCDTIQSLALDCRLLEKYMAAYSDNALTIMWCHREGVFWLERQVHYPAMKYNLPMPK